MISNRFVSEHEVQGGHSPELAAQPAVWKFLALAVVLVLSTLVTYRQVDRLPFISIDDGQYVLQNSHINQRPNRYAVKWAFTTFYASNWHPLTWLSHAFDCRVFGLDPARHHESNLALHAMNALLLFWVLWRATARVGRSFLVAALFALHPINVESVAWIAERKNLLSMFFCCWRWALIAGTHVGPAAIVMQSSPFCLHSGLCRSRRSSPCRSCFYCGTIGH